MSKRSLSQARIFPIFSLGEFSREFSSRDPAEQWRREGGKQEHPADFPALAWLWWSLRGPGPGTDPAGAPSGFGAALSVRLWLRGAALRVHLGALLLVLVLHPLPDPLQPQQQRLVVKVASLFPKRILEKKNKNPTGMSLLMRGRGGERGAMLG